MTRATEIQPHNLLIAVVKLRFLMWRIRMVMKGRKKRRRDSSLEELLKLGYRPILNVEFTELPTVHIGTGVGGVWWAEVGIYLIDPSIDPRTRFPWLAWIISF